MNDTYHLIHFKTERNAYHEQYEISDFPNLNHTMQSVVAFDKSESFYPAADYCDWSFCSI